MSASGFAELTVTAPPRIRAAGEFFRYFACSALALGLDFALYRVGLALGVGYATAAAAGFIAGLALCYALSVRLVFRERRLADSRTEFALFAAIGIAGLLLTEVLLWALIERQRFDPMLAKGATAGAVFFFNFGARKALLFTGRRRAAAE